MASFVLSGESTADLSVEHFKRRDIHCICYHYELDGKTYDDDLGQSMSFDAFYQAMADGAMTRTAQINVDEFIAAFTPFLEAGQDILHLTLSSGITGTLLSANTAKEALAERFPERKIRIVDTLGASSGFGLLLDTLADLRDEGLSLDEAADWAEAHRLKVHHWFFSTDLKYYIRGGRISKTAGAVGTILGICPLMNMDIPGHLIPREKIRGKKKVVETIVQRMAEHAQGGTDYGGKCYISHAGCLADAEAVRDLVEQRFANLKGRVEIYNIGTTIGAHTGPGTVALFFWGDERVD